jgi:hypothetical protein
MKSALDKDEPIEVRVGRLHCRLRRIGDCRYRRLARNGLVIQENYGFLMDLLRDRRRYGELLNLAEFYVAFKEIFGESGSCFDDWKGAFAFPFEVAVFKEDAVYCYVLNVINWRDTVEFNFRKVLPPDERGFERAVIHPPFAAEFSTDEMNTLVAFLYGYVEGALRVIRRYYTDEFVRQVSSNLILFGFHQGRFFEEQYDDCAEFGAARKRLVQATGTPAGHGATTDKEAKLEEVDWEAKAETSRVIAGLIRCLRRRMVCRFGPLPVWAEAWLANAGLLQFETWAERALNAATLREVFAGS